ncbi:hypothetical protein DJ030_04440 [bacterium endosymbiont of Escarpia laminata]|nr:MAG: hypothetical protein DJ030_04440 [bacterium endosymbiont of Escarpia laminata]
MYEFKLSIHLRLDTDAEGWSEKREGSIVIGQRIIFTLMGAALLLGASNAQAAVTTYTDEAVYLAALASLGYEVANEGFDSPDWLATETFPVPSLTNNGLTWAESNGTTNTFLMTTTSGLDGSALRTLNSAATGHTDPDGFYLKTDTATTLNSLHGFGAWYKGNSNGSKVTFTTNGGGVGFTGEESTVLTIWKFLGFIDDVGFTTLDVRVIDDPTNTDVRLLFTDTASIGAPVGTFPAGTLDLSEANYPVNENDGSVSVTVNRTGGSFGAITVDYATSNGTATSGSDYQAINSTLTFAENEYSKVIAINLLDDLVYEGSESFSITLSNAGGGATLGTTTTASIDITDNEPPPSPGTLELSTATESVAENAAGGLTLTVSRTGGSDGTVTVNYATADGTAAAPGDYTAASGTLTFLDGELSQTIPLTLTNDTTWEPDEDFTVTLSNVVDATLGAQTSTTVTITDDQVRSPGTLALSTATESVVENAAGGITLTVSRTGGSDGPVSVDYATADGSALQPGDYTQATGTLTFLDGELSQTIPLTLTNDTTWEPSEDFTVTLSNPVAASLGTQTSTTVTITDDDPRSAGTLALSTATETVAENAAGGITLTVSRTGGTDGPVSVDYATANGTAASPGDYTAVSGTLTFLDGETSQTIPLTLTNDTTWEPSEDFTVTLSNPVAASLGTQTSTTVTITDDDPRSAGTLALSTATETVAENAAGGITLTVSRTGGTDGPVSVDYATANGTAASPGDYTAVSGTLTFLDGETSQTIPLTLTNDTTWEPSEDFTVTLSNPVAASLGTQTSTTVTITDDDTRNAGTLALSSATATLSESGPAITLTVDRTGGLDGTVTVDYATTDGTATAPGDYTALSGTLTFLNGELSKTLTLTPTSDTTWEPSETFTLTLSSPVDAALGLSAATVTIADDDPRSAGTLALSTATETVAENAAGGLTLTVTRTNGSDGEVSVAYATADGTAAAPGDYTAVSGTLTFLDGETSKTIPLTLTNDTTWEPSEDFTVTLSNVVDATLGAQTSTTVTITDDDTRNAGTLALSSATATLSEGGPAITLTVDRTGGLDGTVTVDYATADGTATAPGDYTALSGTLTFLNGELSKTLTLTPTSDTIWEPSETFTLTLSNPVDAALGLSVATVTITDDDPRSAGTLALSTATETVAENAAGGLMLTVSRTGGTDGPVSVDYATANGTAASPGDYTAASGTLNFLHGETSKTIPLTLTNDTTWEPSEDFTVTLSNVVDATLGTQTSTTVTITDDDTRNAGTLALSNATATLSESGPAITLTIDRTGGSDGTVTVDYATADGTANAPGDYTAINGTLTFLEGEISKTIPLTPTSDTVWELNEDFTVTLSNVVDATLGPQTSTTVTITDDDTRTSGTLALSSATATLLEGGPAITLTVDRTGGSDGTVSVDYATVNGTASAPGDYTALNGSLTFLNGELSKTLTLTPANDATWEPSEAFTLTLGNVVDASLGLSTTTVTINDDDTRNAGTLALSTATETVAENAAGGLTLIVSRTGGTDGPVSVDYATANGTAASPGDYTAISGTLNFLHGESNKTIPLILTNDTTWEPSEDFTVTLSNVVDATLGAQTSTTVTITDDDTRNAGTLALNSTTVTLLESGPAVNMTVNRTGGSDGTVSVDYATTDGTATAIGDYTALSGTLTFLNGETSKTVTLTPTDDTTWEPSEDFTLSLSNPVDATLGGQISTTVTITDDDPRSAGTLALSSPTATLSESGPSVIMNVNRTGGSDGTVSVDYATADGTATATSDYTALSGTLTFLNGETSKTVTLTPTDDTTWEPSEDFTLSLSNPVDATLGGQISTTVTITDDDPRSAGTLALNSTTVTLLESGPAVIMTVNRTGGSDGTVSVDYATADGTATAPGDYTALNGTLIFLNGETSKTIPLTPADDTTWEPSEVFTLTLSNVVDASLGLNTATVTISDDDTRTSGTLALSSATATLSESDPAVTLTVDRTGGSDGTVTVDYATSDGTANAPGDYQAISGTLTFLDGELSKTLTLSPTGDAVWEPSEDFTLTLSNVVDASLGLSTATVTITDDDARNAGTLALNSATATLLESGPAVIMTVNRTGGSDGTVSVDYATTDGTATAPGDYTALSGTLIFLNGETSKTIPLTPIGDTVWEPSETFTLTLSNAMDASLGLAAATVTITDDDPRSAGTLDLSRATATLSESGPAVTLTVDRSGGSDGTVSVDYATTDGTATAPGDYTALSGTLTFLDGELSKTVTLTPIDDTTPESSETFTLTLSNAVDATLGLASATVTITDDDDGVAPVITIQDLVISVPSTGPFTSVDLGVVTALDDVDGAVTPVADLTGPFAPGRHLITWRAIDSSSNMASVIQTVDVLPMVNFGVDQVANPGSTVDIPVFLNGDAPEYPVVIEYQIEDFDTTDGTVAQTTTTGTVNITVGTVPSNQANIQYLIQNPGVARVEVTLLDVGANATFGANNVHTINVNVAEMNLPPVVSITGSQNNKSTATVFGDAGQVTLTAVVNDPNPADTHTYDWSQSDNGLALQLGAQPNTVVFDPSGLVEGTYKVVVSVTDFAGDTTTVDKTVSVRASALIFDNDGSDSDGDGVSDFDEGDEDEDEDGIPDYLDPHDDDYILAGQNGDPDDFLLITEPGLKLKLSEEKIRDEDYTADLDEQEFIDRVNGSVGADPQDTHTHVGGIFEFEIEGLAYVGQSVRIVIPVHEAIPANAVYRLYTDDVGWHDFVVDARNSVSSAPGELGICPAPGDVTYIAGLHEGHFCVELMIEDGGRNDADRRANGEIGDPGGVAIVPSSTPTTPQTSSGGGGGIGGWLLILLLGVWLRNIRRESMRGIRLGAVKLMGGGFRTLLLAGLLSSGMVSTVSAANGLLSLYEAGADSVAATLKPDCAFHAQGEAADKEREFPTIVGGVRSEENQLRYRQVVAGSKGYRRTEHNYRMPERKLVSMDGQPTSLATELGGDKPVMLNFIFTTCTTICPVLSATFSQVRESLGSESRNVTMVSISIDPEYDTPERLNEYARLYGADDQWRFLTGRVEDIIAIEKAFDAYRGTKMSHEPLTFLRADGDSPWVRIEGIASADDIVKEYEQLVSR